MKPNELVVEHENPCDALVPALPGGCFFRIAKELPSICRVPLVIMMSKLTLMSVR